MCFHATLSIRPTLSLQSKSERERQILYNNKCMESRKMVLMKLFAGQQWRHRQEGFPQRDGMGMEVGGEFRIENMCTPVVDACWCMAKPIQYCKVKKKKKRNLPAMQETWVGNIPWRRAWKPTPVFLPGESHGQRSLVSQSWAQLSD